MLQNLTCSPKVRQEHKHQSDRDAYPVEPSADAHRSDNLLAAPS
jgi:hypothetical protein